MTHLKIAQNVYFSCEFCTFPVTEGNEIWHLYSSYDPNKKAHPQHEFQESQNYLSLWTRESSNQTQRDMNFRNPKIIHHFGPENPQNWTQKDMNFEKMHSLTPTKMPTK